MASNKNCELLLLERPLTWSHVSIVASENKDKNIELHGSKGHQSSNLQIHVLDEIINVTRSTVYEEGFINVSKVRLSNIIVLAICCNNYFDQYHYNFLIY